jgi:hypothetical protein
MNRAYRVALGSLEFRAISGTTVYTKTIDGYVTHGLGGHTTVTINPEGTISVITATPSTSGALQGAVPLRSQFSC